MDGRFGALTQEPSAAVQAVLGHLVFGFIPPYSDGNGRSGRLLMNRMLASGGYNWAIPGKGLRPGRDRRFRTVRGGGDEGTREAQAVQTWTGFSLTHGLPVPREGSDTVCLVIASPAQPGVAIQLDGLLRRPLRGLLAMTNCTTTKNLFCPNPPA
jgi:hypothetical protein